jgi:hypothetical protein
VTDLDALGQLQVALLRTLPKTHNAGGYEYDEEGAPGMRICTVYRNKDERRMLALVWLSPPARKSGQLILMNEVEDPTDYVA